MFGRFFQVRNVLNKHNPRQKSTIFALSSGQGRCGVAVIRVSGPSAEAALKTLTRLSKPPQPRTATLRSLTHPQTGETLDKGLILWFPGPNSFTGEDSCEFHVHGGLAVISSVLNALGSISGLRLSEPGEFTRRAFDNGKLDLTEVEGLSDLLQAETEFQRKQAFLQSQGVLSKLYNTWRTALQNNLAHIEAHIDFEETETIDERILEQTYTKTNDLKNEILRHLNDGRKGELLRNGVKTVILGAPNVGKSSLLNVLCKRPAAIVTPIEGTTRDVLEVTLNIEGYPLVLADTAGLRGKTDDVIEREGIGRAFQSYKDSDLVILVIDSERYLSKSLGVAEYLKYYVDRLGIRDFISLDQNSTNLEFTKPCLVVFNKKDLVQKKISLVATDEMSLLSCKSEEGITELTGNIAAKLKQLCGTPSVDHPCMNQLRHKQHLNDCVDSLSAALISTNDTVLMAEHLRRALRHLGCLVGATTTEQLLDIIFKDFCIGK